MPALPLTPVTWGHQLSFLDLSFLICWVELNAAHCSPRDGGKSSRDGNLSWTNPLQYSCLGNSMDRGAWRAMVYRIPQRVRHNLAIEHVRDFLRLWNGIRKQNGRMKLKVRGDSKQKKTGSTKENLQAVQIPGFSSWPSRASGGGSISLQDSGCLRLSLCPTHFFAGIQEALG